MAEPGGTRLAANGVTVAFGRLRALDGVSVEFAGTGVQGLIGVNGAGKTTLIHAVTGLLPLTAGTVSLVGSIAAVGYCPDTPTFEPWLTAREVVEQSGLLGRRGAPPVPREAVDAVLARVGLEEARDRRVGGFSRGMSQRLGIAASIVRQPEILILDEPTSALDPVGRGDVMRLMTELGRDMLVVFSSHILEDVEAVAETLAVLHRGSLIYRGPVRDFLATVEHRESVVVTLAGRRHEVCGDLEARGIPWEVEPDDERRLRVPVTALGPLLETLEPHARDLVAVERARTSLQAAFLAAIDADRPTRAVAA